MRKELHSIIHLRFFAFVLATLLTETVNSEDNIRHSFDWHLEGATYGALVIFGQSGTIQIWEILGAKTDGEVFETVKTNSLETRKGEALIVFTYEKFLKQTSDGNGNERYTSRILYRSVEISGERFFSEFGAKSVDEISQIFEDYYSAKKRLIDPVEQK